MVVGRPPTTVAPAGVDGDSDSSADFGADLAADSPQPAGAPEQLLADFDALGVAAVQLDAHWVVQAANRTWQRGAGGGGLFAAMATGRDLRGVIAELGIASEQLTDLITSVGPHTAEPLDIWVPGPGDAPGWTYRLRAGAVSRFGGGIVLTCVDVTTNWRAEQRLRHESTHDRLTGLADRDLLLAEISAVLSGSGGRHLLLYVDIDGFKQVNDAHGQAVADALLFEVARRLVDGSERPAVVARAGGDEFAVLYPAPGHARAALDRARRLHDVLTAPYDVGGRRLVTTVSIGCRITRLRSGESAESVLGDADEAMHQAKQAGRNGVALYSAELHERAVRRSEIEWALGTAVGTNEFRLVYQPQVSLDTGRLLAVEALLRWTSPRLGEVSPLEFVPVAESSSLILPLGAWVLNEACRQLSVWRSTGTAPPVVTVNVSPVQLRVAGFAESVTAALDTYGLEAPALCLEITETALMDSSEAVADTLQALHELGVYLAIDDFGTGHSSLAQLRQLPVELLKIDQSFVAGVDSDKETAGIVTAVLSLAHVLGMYVVAEGVETEGQSRELILRGCHVGQGLRFAGGVPPRQIPGLLASPFPLTPARRGGSFRRWSADPGQPMVRADARSKRQIQRRPAHAGRVRAAAVPRWATGRGCRTMLAELTYQLGLPDEDG